MNLKRIDHIVITVNDVDATISFYTKILDMKEITVQGPGIVLRALRFGDQRIHVHKAGKEFEPKAYKATPGSADICFVTDIAISEIVEILKKNKITIEKQPMVISGTLGQMESVWFRDPDKNLIEISKYL